MNTAFKTEYCVVSAVSSPYYVLVCKYFMMPTYYCLVSCVRLFATPWTVAHPAPLSIEFSRQDYWNGLPFLSVPTYKIIQIPKTLTSESWMGAWVTLIAADQIGPAIE